MIIKKIILGVFILFLMNSCAQTTSLLGPAYTLGTTGNVYQAGLTYTSNQAVTSITGKSTEENITNLLKSKKNDTELRKLVKKRILETRKKLNQNPQ